MWSPRCRRSNVWIAELIGRKLESLRRVQELPGQGPPFARLAALLRKGDYRAAGIDAPFALPARFMPRPRSAHSHAKLLARVAKLPRDDRPFARGADLVRLVAATDPPLAPPKPLRETELRWLRRRVNVRSPLWCGARPGAPMTVACLTLLAEATRPMWPWAREGEGEGEGVLCEAFPSAQAAHWNVRGAAIVEELAKRLDLGRYASTLRASADATDAVLAAFGAIAVARSAREGALVDPPEPIADVEGWVAVHS